MSVEQLPRTIWWEDGSVHMIDQTRLPLQGDVLVCSTYEGVIVAIKTLAVRGAPAIGAAGALGVALWTHTTAAEFDQLDGDYLAAAQVVCDEIAYARPTAVNLPREANRLRAIIEEQVACGELTPVQLSELLVTEAHKVMEEDEAANRKLGAYGAELFDSPTKFLTHCNAGSLATSFYGTALGVIYATHEQGKVEHVWIDETRPVNQGSRLTAWELLFAGVPAQLICDNMAAFVMGEGLVDAVVVGADRVCANGDAANKIGTYGLAILAKEHGIPFYIAAPSTTFDLSLATGREIEIEVRDSEEIEGVTVSGTFDASSPAVSAAFDKMTADGPADLPMSKGHHMQIVRKGGGFAFDAWFKTTPTHVSCFNPAFDVTPAKYITGYITERGVLQADDIAEVMQ
ncbi:MAG: S-methyl-5-thioribose-1-phosphate isomerase [Coriobacteriia bacterium]|nr:S-methyl-5-thioribose-1-phosphate isomerase [Coriobacteriia bacterium]